MFGRKMEIRLRSSQLRREASAFALRDYGVMQWRDGNVGRESIFVMQYWENQIGDLKICDFEIF